MTLTPIVSAPRRPQIAVWDLEWYPQTMKLRLAGFYDGKRYASFEGIPALMRHMLSREYRGYWIFAHFGGMADLAFLQRWFVEHPEYMVEMRFSGSSAVVVEITRGKDKWFLVDSFRLMPDKLAKIMRSIGMTKGSDGMTEAENMALLTGPMGPLRDYNELDCVGLYNAISRFCDEIMGLGGELRPTIASCAMTLFRRRFLKRPIRTAEHLNDRFREAYIASRVEVLRKRLEGGANKYDINSSFPASMVDPCPGSCTGFGTKLPKHDCFIVEASINVKPCYLPPLPVRVDGRIFFPVGRWKTLLTGPDFRFAESLGCIESTGLVWTFEQRTETAEYVHTVYGMRKNETDDFRRLLLKYLLNSLYGKMGEGPDKQVMVINPPRSLHSEPGATMLRPGVWMLRTHRHAKNEHVAMAAHITAKSRERITRYLLQAGDAYYCDTDSIVTKQVLPSSLELGHLKDEGRVEAGYFAAPKFYILDGSVKAKGFPRLDADGFWRVVNGEAHKVERMRRVREMWRNQDLDPQSLIVEKRARFTVDKRKFSPCGESEPYTLREIYELIGRVPEQTPLAYLGHGRKLPAMNLTELREKMARAKAAMSRVREKADNVMDKTLAAAEVAVAAGTVGLVEGYTGAEVTLGGVPAEWVGAAAGHAYGFLSGSKNADHAHNLANGFLAVGSYKGAKKIGSKAKENKSKTGSVFGADGSKQLPEGSRSYSFPEERQTQAA